MAEQTGNPYTHPHARRLWFTGYQDGLNGDEPDPVKQHHNYHNAYITGHAEGIKAREALAKSKEGGE